jgi:hypothetical protein
LGTFSRLRGENRTKKSLDGLCIFDLNQSRLFLGLFCLDFLLPTKLLNCFESCSNIPGMLIFYTPCPLIFLLLFLVSWGDFEIANPAFAPPPSDATAPGGTRNPPRVTMAGGCVVCRQKTRGPPVPNNNAGRGEARMAGAHTESMLFLGRKTPGKANQGGKYSRLQHNLKYSRLYNSRVHNFNTRRFCCLIM